MTWLVELSSPGGQVLSGPELDGLTDDWGYVVQASDWLAWHAKYDLQHQLSPFKVDLVDMRDFKCRWHQDDGLLSFVSPFDGRQLQLSLEKLRQCLSSQPLLLDEKTLEKLQAVVSQHDIYVLQPSRVSTAHTVNSDWVTAVNLAESTKTWQGTNSAETVRYVLPTQRASLLQTNTPLTMALQGQALFEGKSLSMRDAVYASQHQAIAPDCSCQTCSHFTRAYLYHLYEHCQALAVRYLALHNVHRYWHCC